MNYTYCESIAHVPFRVFIAWQMGRPLENAHNMELDSEIIDYFNSTDPLLDDNCNAASLDQFKDYWKVNRLVIIYEVSIGPNGFHEIGFMIDDVQYSQDFDLEDISVLKLFKYAN